MTDFIAALADLILPELMGGYAPEYVFWRKSGTVVVAGVPDVFFALWVDWLIDFFEEREKAMCQLVGG